MSSEEIDVELEVLIESPQPQNTFVSNCFSDRRQQIDSSQLFHYRELLGHTDYIGTMGFSEDGTLLVSGGTDKTVRLWSLNQGRRVNSSCVMETKHERAVSCLAMSPDNNQIFSGGFDSKIYIHDVQT